MEWSREERGHEGRLRAWRRRIPRACSVGGPGSGTAVPGRSPRPALGVDVCAGPFVPVDPDGNVVPTAVHGLLPRRSHRFLGSRSSLVPARIGGTPILAASGWRDVADARAYVFVGDRRIIPSI